MASGDLIHELSPLGSEAIVSGGSVARATYSTRNGVAALDFPAGSGEDAAAEWGLIMPPYYSGGGITVVLHWVGATGVSTNQVHWKVIFENAQTTSIDSLTYAVGATTTSEDDYDVSSNGVNQITTFTVAAGAPMDNVVAENHFRFRLQRDPDEAADNYAGDAQMLKCFLKET